jgi:SAM-dependent methyltransferase
VLTALRRARRSLPLGLRSDAVELLDGDGLSLAEIERNLLDLARLGRLPGGVGASVAGVRRLVGGRDDVQILDAGTGRGDLPIAFARHGWTTVAVDTHPEVLRIARRQTAAEPRVEVVDADVLALPFDDHSFDVAHSSLLVHHLDPRGVVGALRELRRVARHGVVINDLRRGILPLVATALSVAALGGSHVTRNDSVVSARRAYTLDELDDLIGEAGLSVAWRSWAWMPRVVTAATPTAGA